MAPYQPGLIISPSPQAVQLVRERLERLGHPIGEAAARSLIEAVLAVEAPRMQAIARGILHGSLETIRQTAEVALGVLRERRPEQPDLVGVVREHLSAEPQAPHRRGKRERIEEDDPRPVFKRRGR
ncbi:MAG TPA: hypothetical protein VFU40_04695 [Gemmatimonadales bacterium]|nr:hypothetical protein [Gemmatimonadales bacterium]